MKPNSWAILTCKAGKLLNLGLHMGLDLPEVFYEELFSLKFDKQNFNFSYLIIQLSHELQFGHTGRILESQGPSRWPPA